MATILIVGVSLSINMTSNVKPVYATQHFYNYDEYTYTGHYYDSIDYVNVTEGLNGTLRERLTSLIFPKAWYTYSGSTTGKLGKVLQDADQDPTNSANMVLFYSRDSITKRGSGDGVGNWNREHVWPQSLSNGHWGKTEAGTDILHIRPTWYTTNNTRGNTVYGSCTTGAQYYDGMLYAYYNGVHFEPLDAVKGDVARILMYVWTAYTEYYHDSSLKVTNAIESYDTLLKWHTMDLPDALEGSRNNFSESSNQKNRNPFVDHPEFAWQIFGDSASAEVKEACKAAYPAEENQSHGGNSSSSEPISSSEPVVISESSFYEESSEEIETTIPSSEEPVISSEPAVSSSEESKKNARGCKGSIIGIASLTGASALIGLVFILSKKKEE